MLPAVLVSAAIATGSMLAATSATQAQEMVRCARENGFCRVPYPTRVIYGARGWSTERFVQGRGIPCSNQFFGDPAPGVAKSCSYVVRYERRRPRRWHDEFREAPPGYGPRYRDYDRGYYGQPY